MPESIEAAWLREQWRTNPSLASDFDGRWIAVRGTEIIGAHERLAVLIRELEGPSPEPGGERGGSGTPRGPGGGRGPVVEPELDPGDARWRWLPSEERGGGMTEARSAGGTTALARRGAGEEDPTAIRLWHGGDEVLSFQQMLAEVERRRRMREDAATRPLYAFISRRARA